MEEKIIIKSKRYTSLFVIILSIMLLIAIASGAHSAYEQVIRSEESIIDVILSDYDVRVSLIACTGPIILVSLYLAWVSRTKLTVTDKRVYGKAVFGKRVDIPLDKIIGIEEFLTQGISITSIFPSKRFKFRGIRNKHEICIELEKLVANQENFQQEKLRKSREDLARKGFDLNGDYSAQAANYAASGGRSFTSPDAQKPQSAAGAMVKGAVVGNIVAGPAGAVVGAMVGKEKHDAKNK